MNRSLSRTLWHGLAAWKLENDTLRTVIIPELGAKLVSLYDKRCQMEWLADSGDRPVKQVPYGAVFTDQDMSGWDEMFPTIVACEYPAPGEYYQVLLPDHGEVWALPWKREAAPDDSLKLSVQGLALPYRLSRTLSFVADACLQMDFCLENLGAEPLAYIWAAHPQFVCGESSQICLPEAVRTVCNVLDPDWGWGEPETSFSWPEAMHLDGQPFRLDRTGPPSLKQARKFYITPDTSASWAGLSQYPGGPWVQMRWDAKVPYLGLWIDEGALSHTTVTAPEPATGFYDSLEVAWKKKKIALISPGATQSWSLAVCLGAPGQPFPAGW